MTVSAEPGVEPAPGLLFFHTSSSGRCRRVEGFLAQVLQRRRNHSTFKLYRVEAKERPDLLTRFRIADVPSFVVIEGKQVTGRLEQPRGCQDIEQFLAPWLR